MANDVIKEINGVNVSRKALEREIKLACGQLPTQIAFKDYTSAFKTMDLIKGGVVILMTEFQPEGA